MKFWNSTAMLWLLAIISAFAIVMMLILDGIWDQIMLAVSLLPLCIAVYRIYRF